MVGIPITSLDICTVTNPMANFDLPDAMKLRLPHRPVVGDAEFRAAMSAVAASVHVVTARRGDERIGRTVTSLMSLAADPPTVLVSIDIMSRLADLIAKTSGFSVAVLADDQRHIANAFAGRVAAAERFGLGEWSAWPSGHPMLVGTASGLDCEVIGSIETGTHVLFAGAIVDAQTTTGRQPLIWHRHGYHRVAGME
ncbi:MAG: flavin reductase [Devosia sp.]|nr:flavin reductase [Devosia sp.]